MRSFIKKILFNKVLDIKLKSGAGQEMLNFPQQLNRVRSIVLFNRQDEGQTDHSAAFRGRLMEVFPGVRIEAFDGGQLTDDQRNWFGFPSSAFQRTFKERRYDLLIDLNQIPQKLDLFFVSICAAPMKLNIRSGEHDRFYNLHFRGPADTSPEHQLNLIADYLAKLRRIT